MALFKIPRLNTDYGFLQKAIPLIGLIGIVSHIPFYLLLKYGFGYQESLVLRILLPLGVLPFLFYPRQSPLGFGHKVYFETIIAIELPFAFTYFWFLNDGNIYWSASLAFAGMLYGLIAKPYFFPFLFPLSGAAASLLYLHFQPGSSHWIGECLKAQIVGYFSGFFANAIKTALENSHYKILEERERGLQTRMALHLSEQEADQARKVAEESLVHARELGAIIETLQSYTRPSLVAFIEKGMDPRTLLPTEKDFTVLNCDMREFTALTERMHPQEQIKLLNSYFSMMTDAVEEHGGEMDKFIGDAFMALFENPERAGMAAMDCRRALQKYNELMMKGNRDFQPIQNGMGIARGMVTHGNIGSVKKFDLTVIGNAANISARLEALTKKYNVDILVTEEIIESMGGYPHSRWIDQVKVRGSRQGLRIYELYGHQAEDVVKYKDSTKDLLDKALRTYFQRGFGEAERMFKELLAQSPPHRHLMNQPMDRIYLFYLRRCDAKRSDPNGYGKMLEQWDGFHEFAE
ncbi:MAG: family 3 adenylate cyclase [Fibrobacteres bacterium]|nr:family 3 adenylate cyclase [Fibrobacterota bacterium]